MEPQFLLADHETEWGRRATGKNFRGDQRCLCSLDNLKRIHQSRDGRFGPGWGVAGQP